MQPQRTCPHCGMQFTPRASGKPQRFCTRACKRARERADYVPRIRKTLAGRFWAKVAKSEEPDGCWEWQGGKGSEGYGLFTGPDGRKHNAHHVAWQLTHGDVPQDMVVCHDCPRGDNKLCVRLDHLFLGTQAENLADMARKGRRGRTGPRGSGSLLGIDPRQLVDLHDRGHSQQAIATMFGVNQTSVSRALQRARST